MNSMKMPAHGQRLRRARCVMRADAVGRHRITPQPHPDSAEGVEVGQCVHANRFGQDDDRLVGEKTVATRLTHGSAPVRQLALKGACTGTGHGNERLRCRKPFVRKRLPCHHHHVCNPVSVHGDFTCQGHGVVFCRTVHFGCLSQIGPGESDCESILGGCRSSASRQVSSGLRKSNLRYYDSGLIHQCSPDAVSLHVPVQNKDVFYPKSTGQGHENEMMVQRSVVCVNGAGNG